VKLTIAIPTYNRARSLIRLLDQIRKQLTQDDELLVVNDCSTDNTSKSLASRSELRVVENRSNLGMVRTWNRCLEEAENEWVCIIHDDDLLSDNALKTIRRSCEALNQPGLVGHVKAGMVADCGLHYVFREPGPLSVMRANFLPSGVSIHKKIFHRLGGFNESFLYSPDIEYFARVASFYPILLVENPSIIEYQQHSANHQYQTWMKDDFFIQLTSLEKRVIEYANLKGVEADRFYKERMNAHFSHILRVSSLSSNSKLQKEMCGRLLNMPETSRRNRVRAALGKIIRWIP